MGWYQKFANKQPLGFKYNGRNVLPISCLLVSVAFNRYLCGLLFASLALMKSHGHENSNTYFSGALSMKLARGTTELLVFPCS